MYQAEYARALHDLRDADNVGGCVATSLHTRMAVVRPEGCQGLDRIRAVLALHSLYENSVYSLCKSG